MNRKRSRKLSKRKSKNKRSMKRSNSRKTSKRQSIKLKRSSKRRYKSTYRFPGKVEMLGICVLDEYNNYAKVNNIIDTLKDNRIVPEDKEVNFCMLNEMVEDYKLFFNCQIKGSYGSEELSQVYNKKYDIILLDGCPYIGNITFYTPQNILQLEKNIKENGYIVVSIPKKYNFTPEGYMRDEEGVKMEGFWLDTFRKVNKLVSGDYYIHIYKKNIMYEDEPGTYNPYGEGESYLGVPGGPRF